MTETLDVVIVGAGLSGIGAACTLKRLSPWARFAILEARGALGGTWDQFRYPGMRADSDMFTLGYSFEPWTGKDAIADGATILDYVRGTAKRFGVDKAIRFHTRVIAAAWDSHTGLWTLEAETPEGRVTLAARQIAVCAGYFRYDRAHRPDLAGLETFAGPVLSPQFWPQDFDYAGRKVLVVGGGATAVTLVPALAKTADVTLLQRSPAYVVSRPARAPMADFLRRRLPAPAAHSIVRGTQAVVWALICRWMRKNPVRAKAYLMGLTRKALGPGVDIADFTPHYAPWDERMCVALDGDFFDAVREGRARVVTEGIDTFTPQGVRTASGRFLAADVVVLATGLEMNWLGDLVVTVDGERIEMASRRLYKGCMYEGVPNFVSLFGYVNSSWTLKVEMIAAYLCRQMNFMRAKGFSSATPPMAKGESTRPLIDFTSGYVMRASGFLPKQGAKEPWRAHQDYLRDLSLFGRGRIDDGVLRFQRFPQGAAHANGLPP